MAFNKNVLTKIKVFSLILITCFFNWSYSQTISEAQKLCADITPVNRALAERAGYDLDTVCAELRSVTSAKKPIMISSKKSRPTISTETSDEMVSSVISPVAVSGISKPEAAAKLKPFGYDLFANSPTTFAPAESIPVSADYLLGPGDTLDILFYGNKNNTVSLLINREGYVDFPELGPIGVSGMTYSEAKKLIENRVAEQIVGTSVSISMGALRSMQIFVLGEAFKPGAYTVSSLSTITHGLVSSGGVSSIGSLRKIELKRDGAIVAKLDLYDLLLKGDTSGDLRLQPSDVIYIPTVGDMVSIEGQVLRPAIYELKGGEVIADLLRLSGGLGPKAFPSAATLSRVDGQGFMTALDINLNNNLDTNKALKNGDHLSVSSIINTNRSVVSLQGHLYHPRQLSYISGMRVSDLLAEIKEQRPGLDLDYAMVTRTDPVTGYLSAIHVNLRDILENKKSETDVDLKDRDVLRLFGIDGDRAQQLKGLIDALNKQKRIGKPPKIATVEGVRLPGTFPITKDMRLSELIFAGGGLDSNYPDLNYALLVREKSLDGDIEVVNVSLGKINNDPRSEENILVKPKDRLIVFSINDNRPQSILDVVSQLKSQAKFGSSAMIVDVGGTVRYPGTYPLTPNMSLKDLIAAAGGFTEGAYINTAEITRKDLSNSERAARRIFLTDLNNDSATLMHPGDSVQLRVIPDFSEINKISLEGEFLFPGEYSFEKGETLKSVINRAGGFTDEAFIDGSIFLRNELRVREQTEINRLMRQLEEDLTANQLRDINSNVALNPQSMDVQQKALDTLASLDPIGRLVIPLKAIMNGNSKDVILKNGDRLLIPKFTQEVSVIGEVQRQTSYFYNPKLNRGDYIEKSGGFTEKADRQAIYIVKANGEIFLPKNRLFIFPSIRNSIGPGDTIVVPFETDETKVRGLPLLASVSTIIYQLSLGAAAINSFNSN